MWYDVYIYIYIYIVRCQRVKDLAASVTDPCVENSTDILRYDYQYTVQNMAEKISVKERL